MKRNFIKEKFFKIKTLLGVVPWLGDVLLLEWMTLGIFFVLIFFFFLFFLMPITNIIYPSFTHVTVLNVILQR